MNKEAANMEYGKAVKNWNKKTRSGHFTLWKCYVSGALRKTQNHYFFCGVPVSRMNDFYICNLSKECKVKIEKVLLLKYLYF